MDGAKLLRIFINKLFVLLNLSVREAPPKSSSLNGGVIKAYPPPLLMAVGTLERWKVMFFP